MTSNLVTKLFPRRFFARVFRRNKAFFNLAITTNLEYRLNYFVDAIAQPVLNCLIEIALWSAIFRSLGKSELVGFGKDYYVAYAIWGSFIARISSNWMYEFRMIEEINSGTINSVITRPMSFFEYYLSQFMGYKVITTLISMTIPLFACWFFDLPILYSRAPITLLLVTYYLIFLYLISFIISTFSFYLNRIYGLTVVKNFTLWILSGELIPLDIFPEPYKEILTKLPFSNGVFIPTAYLTGRIGIEKVNSGFASVSLGILITGLIAAWAWKKGVHQYTGTGA